MHGNETGVLEEQSGAWVPLVTYSCCLLGLSYRRCQLISKEDVTHDTRLFCLMLPPSTHLQVPVGHHVYLKLSVTGKGIRATVGWSGGHVILYSHLSYWPFWTPGFNVKKPLGLWLQGCEDCGFATDDLDRE